MRRSKCVSKALRGIYAPDLSDIRVPAEELGLVSKKYFFFGNGQAGTSWEQHAWKVQQEGIAREGALETPTEEQVVGGKRRVRHKDAAIGLDSMDAHMSGDPVVTTAEIPDGKGGITQYVERYSTSGKFIGSYEVQWEKVAEGRHILARTKRITH